jgi:hypothetical protein
VLVISTSTAVDVTVLEIELLVGGETGLTEGLEVGLLVVGVLELIVEEPTGTTFTVTV